MMISNQYFLLQFYLDMYRRMNLLTSSMLHLENKWVTSQERKAIKNNAVKTGA